MTRRAVRQCPWGLVLLLSTSALAYTDDDERKSFVIFRTDAPPVIDGRLDDEAWQHAAIVDDFHQTEPTDGAAPTEKTIVRIMYDDEFLYVAGDLRDSDAARIRALQLVQGKPFFSDDRFWIALDSFNSKRNDYFFIVNANGMRREALRENNSRFISEWTTIWYAESRVHEDGWTTEIAIPFNSISFAPDADTWGINFGRGIVRKQEWILWSSHERQDWPAYAGEVRGIDTVEQGLGIDIVPSINVRQRRDLVLGDETLDIEPSLDVRYRVTPSLTAALTINTDFSTTEVDELQVALDRFSLFFPEKRDFFLQDAGIFEFGNIETNGRPFFSRRIGLSDDGAPIGLDAGAKLTGRIGDFNVGALAIRQEAYADVDATDLLVARGSRNILDESAVGFIATYGDPASNDNSSLIGFDLLYHNSAGPFGQIVTGTLWAQQSDTPGKDGDDRAFGASLEVPNDKLRLFVSAQEIQENFDPALGFVNRAGIRRYEGEVRHRIRPRAGRWREVNNHLEYRLVTDRTGTTLSRQASVRPISLLTHGDDALFIEWEYHEELVLENFELFERLNVPAGRYEFDRYRAEISTGWQRPLRVVLSVQDGDFFGGERFEKFVELEWRQSAHFLLGASLTENDISLPTGSFTSHLASLRGDVAINARWSWRNVLQYDNSVELLGVNSRLRYVPEPGRELVFVLNHSASVDPENRLHSTQNELNLKLSYTFRY